MEDKSILTYNFCHPFLFLLINREKVCSFDNICISKKLQLIESEFSIKTQNLTSFDINSIIYNFIDELCGILVYELDQSMYMTTNMILSEMKVSEEDFMKLSFQGKVVVWKEKTIKLKFAVKQREEIVTEGEASFYKIEKMRIPQARF